MSVWSRQALIAICTLSLAGCVGATDGTAAAPSNANSTTTNALSIKTRITSADGPLGAPSFAWIDSAHVTLPAHANAAEVAWGTLRAVAPDFKLSPESVESARLVEMHDIGRGPLVSRFRQSLDGLDVFRAQLNVAMQRDLRPVGVTGALAPSMRKLTSSWTLDANKAVAVAYRALTGNTGALGAMRNAGLDSAGHTRLQFSAVAKDRTHLVRSRVKKVWFPQASGLRAAYYVEVDVADDKSTSSTLHSYVIDADKGGVLFEHNMTQSDAQYRVWADTSGPKGNAPMDSPYGLGVTPNPAGMFDASAMPPSYVTPSLIQLNNVPFTDSFADPWIDNAATELSGNNVHAYADLAAPDGYMANTADVIVPPTTAGNGTTGPIFDRVYDPTTIPGPMAMPGDNNANAQAITTNLFFIVNYMHDMFYASGYDEKSGNAQLSNFGRGGVEGDPVNAESQDYSGVDNANCSTPADGASPRIQMYEWDMVSQKTLTASPAVAFTGKLSLVAWNDYGWTISLPVVKYLDNSGGTSLGCVAPSNGDALNGNIALIDRGSCAFTQKGENAFAVHAKGVIFADDLTDSMDPTRALDGNPIGDSDDMLSTFPGMGLTYSDGQLLKAAMAAGTVTLTSYKQPPTRDGAVDGTIVSHEWGHSLSNRLIGDGNGLNSNQSGGMGEGWSDFVSLLTYIRPDDANVASNANFEGAYPTGTYALGGSAQDLYGGIRRYPYSHNKAINPLTFADIQAGQALPTTPPANLALSGSNNAEVHATGEIWTTMLWDCYVGLLQDTQHYTFAQAGQAMRDYLVAALKMTPVDPTFIEARDAVLMAALANSAHPDDFMTFANAFARRGAGTGAVAPPRYQWDNTGVVESYMTGPGLALDSFAIDDGSGCDGDHVLDNGETGTITVQIANIGVTTITDGTVTLSSSLPGVSFPDGATVKLDSMAPFATSKKTIAVKLDGAPAMSKADFKVSLNAANLVPKAGPIDTDELALVDLDWKANASATDHCDAPTTQWVTSNDTTSNPYLVDANFLRQPSADGVGQYWVGPTTPQGGADMRLTSPPLTVGSGDFKFTFQHHYWFATDDATNASPMTFYDGGIIELSADNGATWTDIGAMASPGYTQTLDNQLLEPFGGQMAFAGQSAGYPADITTTVDLQTAYAGKTVLVRFRVGNNAAGAQVGAGPWIGWAIDDIAFSGITNTPFTDVAAQADACGGGPADMGTGGGKKHKGCDMSGSGTPTSALPLASLLLLGFAVRRRRARD